MRLTVRSTTSSDQIRVIRPSLQVKGSYKAEMQERGFTAACGRSASTWPPSGGPPSRPIPRRRCPGPGRSPAGCCPAPTTSSQKNKPSSAPSAPAARASTRSPKSMPRPSRKVVRLAVRRAASSRVTHLRPGGGEGPCRQGRLASGRRKLVAGSLASFRIAAREEGVAMADMRMLECPGLRRSFGDPVAVGSEAGGGRAL
jgi:hypothetical protein